MKGDSLARIRSRDCWVTIREIPPVHTTLSAESTMVECGGTDNASEHSSSESQDAKKKKKNQRRPTPRYRAVDDRQEDNMDDDCSASSDPSERMEAPEDCIGFEVAMSLGGSNSTNDESDTGGTYSTEGSCLDFPLDELPGSASTSVYEATKSGRSDFRKYPRLLTEIDERRMEDSNKSVDASIINSSPAAKGRKSLFVDVKADIVSRPSQGSDRKDHTPRTTNRSEGTRASKLIHSTAYKMSLKNKKKEGVAATLATVVLEVNNTPVKPSSSESLPDQYLNYTDTDDSSAEVDARWETFHAKYATDDLRQDSETANAPYDDSGDQQQWRDRLLDVNSYTSPKSVESGGSETFEDLLIQDCIETGLPSPDKRRPNTMPCNFDFSPDSSEAASSKTPTRDNISPKRCISQMIDNNKEEHTCRSTVKDDVLKRAEAQSVSSNLTGDDDEDDDGCPEDGVCSQIHSTISSFSDSENMNENDIVPRLSQVISSQSEDLTIQSQLDQDHKAQPVILPATKTYELPKQSLISTRDDDIPTPKIEISLVPSTSGSGDSVSDVSETSFAYPKFCEHNSGEEMSMRQSANVAVQRPQHEQESVAGESQGRLYWWRKNGKRLVKEVLGTPQKLSPKCHTQDSLTITAEQEPNAAEQMLRRNGSLFDDRSSSTGGEKHSKTEKFASAFKRGISMFEKGNSKTPKPTSTPPRRESRQNRLFTKPLSISSLTGEGREKSIHAPQPKPDADGSNSISQGRRHKLLNDEKIPSLLEDICEDNAFSKPNLDAISTNKGRFSRPGHEDVSVDGAMGLGPSPKVLKDFDCASTNEDPRYSSRLEMYLSQSSGCDDQRKETESDTKNIFFRNRSNQSQGEESNYAADILDVASTLTGETSMHHQTEKSSITENSQAPLPRIPKGDKLQDNAATLVSGRNKDPILDVKGTSFGPDIPSWRLAPTQSLSDFTLQVHSIRSGQAVMYHVHKHILGVGPRRSEFMEGLFRSNTVATAKITIEDEASGFVSNLLDYAYSHDSKLDLTTDNVMVYRYLARVFKIHPVIMETAKFILPDLKIENMSTYISHSSRFNDEIVTNIIAATCGEQLESINIKDVLWTVMDPVLFSRVISCPKIDRRKVSTQLSLLLAEYHSLHKYEMDIKIFEEVCAISILPLIHHEAAIPLLEICEEYGAPVNLQPLQKRCAQVMACYWKTTSDNDRKRLFSLLRSLPSHFTVDFLELVESGNTMAWLDDTSLSKVLRDSKRIAQRSTDIENNNSFTLETLCGDYSRNPDHDLPLSWRTDSKFSFSDWAVKVKHRDEDKIDVYHVHKHILSVGQYRSTFFAETFLSEDHTNTRTGSTTIELAEGPAELVPVVLDFLYSPNHDLVISTRTACALRFLSRVFGIEMLDREVLEYTQRDMDLMNMLVYLGNAELYDDDRIMNTAIRKCAIGIKGIDTESHLLASIKPDFFGRVIASSEIDKSASCHVNILIAKYFTLHDLDECLLAELMKQVPMKECDQESALKLLDVMSSVKAQGVAIFADIRRRCADILVENWRDIRETNREETFKILRTLDSALLADIFDAVENEYWKEHYETMSVQSRLVKRYRAQLADAKSQREEELAKFRQQSELVVSELLEKHQELEAELADYRDATSRRALRSCGGFPPTRIPSPRRNMIDSSRQSFIPRLNVRPVAPTSPTSISDRLCQPGQQLPEPTFQQHASLFGRVFGCNPDTSEEITPNGKGMTHAFEAAQHHQQRLNEKYN